MPDAKQIEVLQSQVRYHADPLHVFERLSQTGSEHVLLESAEIDSKQELKSLLLIDPAVKLICNGHSVTIHALSPNGENILEYLSDNLADTFTLTREESTLTIDCSASETAIQTEEERLRAPGNLTPLRLLQQIGVSAQHPFSLTLAGIFGFDLIASFETLPDVETGLNTCPDYQFYLAETLLIFDHTRQQSELIGTLFSGPQARSYSHVLIKRMAEIKAQLSQMPLRANTVTPALPTMPEPHVIPDQSTFIKQVTELKSAIRDGDIFQVVPSRQFILPCRNPLAAYQQLKQGNPSPYMFYLQATEFTVFGASPESALKYQSANRQIELYPIAGTRPRGKHPDGRINLDLDTRVELDLRQDQKEVAEHMMLVDLARNDLARVAASGSRYVADLLNVDRYSQVMHLVSRVVATLRPDLDALDAYRACMNMGTLTGAPKLSATTLIRRTEQQRRGSYGGAVGYLSGNGDMDTCIVIRSAFVRNHQAIIQAGAGIVNDSDPASECAETEHKARAVIQAIQRAQQATTEIGHEYA